MTIMGTLNSVDKVNMYFTCNKKLQMVCKFIAYMRHGAFNSINTLTLN